MTSLVPASGLAGLAVAAVTAASDGVAVATGTGNHLIALAIVTGTFGLLTAAVTVAIPLLVQRKAKKTKDGGSMVSFADYRKDIAAKDREVKAANARADAAEAKLRERS